MLWTSLEASNESITSYKCKLAEINIILMGKRLDKEALKNDLSEARSALAKLW